LIRVAGGVVQGIVVARPTFLVMHSLLMKEKTSILDFICFKEENDLDWVTDSRVECTGLFKKFALCLQKL
jgi:hypothetical protein